MELKELEPLMMKMMMKDDDEDDEHDDEEDDDDDDVNISNNNNHNFNSNNNINTINNNNINNNNININNNNVNNNNNINNNINNNNISNNINNINNKNNINNNIINNNNINKIILAFFIVISITFLFLYTMPYHLNDLDALNLEKDDKIKPNSSGNSKKDKLKKAKFESILDEKLKKLEELFIEERNIFREIVNNAAINNSPKVERKQQSDCKTESSKQSDWSEIVKRKIKKSSNVQHVANVQRVANIQHVANVQHVANINMLKTKKKTHNTNIANMKTVIGTQTDKQTNLKAMKPSPKRKVFYVGRLDQQCTAKELSEHINGLKIEYLREYTHKTCRRLLCTGKYKMWNAIVDSFNETLVRKECGNQNYFLLAHVETLTSLSKLACK
ncbi:hypothetical protein HELRODRAFT_168612 [Helobdella robusta]|uniref:Uncharacterized protein n=1 Tax=Helobdella robusta TaxID=6412 RepID=T1F0S6_HELRO|nr:hypothetical protein HELRODRAFT_168612 [Helobdella robusta]ESO09604.1 hypothetical protein HELRODRAFT_168612 [Helobdella robusta]